VRLLALLLALFVAGCGSTQSVSSFGEVPLILPPATTADEAGLYLATERAYDEAEGVELQLAREGDADFRLTADPPSGCITVMAVVPPDKLVLCVDEVILQDNRDKVLAVVRALQRGYTQAQVEPEEAISAMTAQLPDADRAELSAQLDAAASTWTAGQPYFGAIERGPGRDSSVARDANEERH